MKCFEKSLKLDKHYQNNILSFVNWFRVECSDITNIKKNEKPVSHPFSHGADIFCYNATLLQAFTNELTNH